jgi:hypothetical protein
MIMIDQKVAGDAASMLIAESSSFRSENILLKNYDILNSTVGHLLHYTVSRSDSEEYRLQSTMRDSSSTSIRYVR